MNPLGPGEEQPGRDISPESEPGDPAGLDRSFRALATRGLAWTGAQVLGVRALSLVNFIILARLLSPAEYGIAALANVFVLVLSALTAGGFSLTLVQRRQVDREDLDTVFWFATGTGFVLAALLFLAAPSLADLYGDPILQPVLRVLSVAFVFVGIGSTPIAVIERTMDLRRIAVPTFAANLVATLVGIPMAFAGLGVWAIVAQTVVGSGLLALSVLVLSGYRPGASASARRFRAIFSDSRNFLGISLLDIVNQRSDDFLIGAFLTTSALGVYAVAYRIVEILIEVLSQTITRVAFPAFSRLQTDLERLVRAFRSATRMAASVALPIFLFAAIAAKDLIVLVFGAKWEAAGPVMSVLCVYGGIQCLVHLNIAALQSVGGVRFAFRLGVLGTVLQLAAFAIGVSYGLVWVAAAYLVRVCVMGPIEASVTLRRLGASARTYLGDLARPVACCLVMAAATLAVALASEGLGPAPRVGLELVTALAVYLVALTVFARDALAEMLGYARRLTGRAEEPDVAPA